jgi:ketosteroid isomerase-like protein
MVMARKAKRTSRGGRPARRRPAAARPAAARGAGASGAPAAIRKLDEVFMKAVAARDVAALVQGFYAPDAVLMPPNHPAVEGREKIQQFLQGLLDAGASSIKLSTTRIWGAGSVACGRGVYTLAMNPPGGVPSEDSGKYIVCYRRQANGSWRAVADIFNSDAPAR